MVKLEETEKRRRLHIGSYFVDLNETDYQELIKIFSNKSAEAYASQSKGLRWVKVTGNEVFGDRERIEIFSPDYKGDDNMRHRIIDAQFLSILKDATHFRRLDEPSESTTPTVPAKKKKVLSAEYMPEFDESLKNMSQESKDRVDKSLAEAEGKDELREALEKILERLSGWEDTNTDMGVAINIARAALNNTTKQ
jgi:hypothetical protein